MSLSPSLIIPNSPSYPLASLFHSYITTPARIHLSPSDPPLTKRVRWSPVSSACLKEDIAANYNHVPTPPEPDRTSRW